LTTNLVLCRKSTDLSWDGDEPNTAAAKEISTPAAEESTPLPQAETVAPVVEATLPEASVVEGHYAAVMRPSSSSSQSPRGFDPGCLVLTGVEVNGSTIPEAVPVEGVVPEAEVATDVDVVWTLLGPLPWWLPGPTTRWAPGITRLVPHGT
jgi:hypothetical protein